MSNQMDYEELVSEYEVLAKTLHQLFDSQAWTTVHMGGQYRRARIILTDDEYERLKELSAHVDNLLANMLAY